MDGDPAHSHLLRFALTEDNFTDTTGNEDFLKIENVTILTFLIQNIIYFSVLLCVAMTTPWNIMDQLKNWARILQDHIDKLTLSAETTKKLQNESKILHTFVNTIVKNDVLREINSFSDIRRWQSYVEPGDEIETGSPTKRISRNNLEPLNGKKKLKKIVDLTKNFHDFFFFS